MDDEEKNDVAEEAEVDVDIDVDVEVDAEKDVVISQEKHEKFKVLVLKTDDCLVIMARREGAFAIGGAFSILIEDSSNAEYAGYAVVGNDGYKIM